MLVTLPGMSTLVKLLFLKSFIANGGDRIIGTLVVGRFGDGHRTSRTGIVQDLYDIGGYQCDFVLEVTNGNGGMFSRWVIAGELRTESQCFIGQDISTIYISV